MRALSFILRLLVVVTAVAWFAIPRGPTDPLCFDEHEWKRGSGALRERMSVDLVETKLNVGMSRTRLITMLGDPDRRMPGPNGYASWEWDLSWRILEVCTSPTGKVVGIAMRD